MMSTHKKLIGGAIATVLAFSSLSCVSSALATPLEEAGIKAVIPAVRHFSADDGQPWKLSKETKIVAPSDLKDDANKLALDLAIKGKIKPTVEIDGEADADDIVLRVDPELKDVPRDDGYQIVSTKDRLTVTGKSADGAFWGEQTVVQSVASSGGVQAGTVRDWADVSERSFHQDMARKFYSKNYLLNLIHQLSYRKINTLQLHFSENEGFRLESKKHPEIMSSDGYISQSELAEILAEAKKYHIEVIPALDMPGHMKQVLSQHADLRLEPRYIGSNNEEHLRGLDFSKPEAEQFVKELIDEFAPLFPDTNKWHLGADEYVNFTQAGQKYPAAVERIKAKLGQDKEFVDGFVSFINDMATYVKDKYHKTDVRVWNDAFYRSDVAQKVELNKDLTIDYWTNWDRPMTSVQDFVDRGFKLVNFNDAYMYFVLGEAAGYKYPTVERVYLGQRNDSVDGGFHAGRFPGLAQGRGPQAFPQEKPVLGKDTTYPTWLRGASFAIWSDIARALTEEQVADKSKGPYTAFADRVWYSGDKRTIKEFTNAMAAVGDAPEIPANIDQIVVGTQSDLVSPQSGTAVKPGMAVTVTGQIKNTSNQTFPIDAKVTSTFLETAAGDVPVKVLDNDGKPVMSEGKNVALASEGATAKASSVEVAKFDASKAIDGDASNADSRWSSVGKKDGESITVTFKEATDLVKLRLAWEGAYATKYTVSYAHPDGSTTVDKFAFTRESNKNAVWAEHSIDQKRVTAITITGNERSLPDYGISLFEIEAYSAGGPLKVAPAKLNNTGKLTWNGSLEPSQSISFAWDATIAKDADKKASVELTSAAEYVLKPAEPSVATLDFIVDRKPQVPDTHDEKPVPPVDPQPEPAPQPEPPARPHVDWLPLVPGINLDPVYSDSGMIEKALADESVKLDGQYTVERGENVKVTFAGLEKNAQARVYLYSEPTKIGDVTASDSGSAEFDVKTTDAPLGTHYVVATSNVAGMHQPSSIVRITVVESRTDGHGQLPNQNQVTSQHTQVLAKTGSSLTFVGVISVTLLGFGMAMILLRRRYES